MRLRSLKTWQWILIGAAVGLVAGTIRAMWAAQQPVGGRGFITIGLFVEALQAPPTDGKSYVTNVVIHPCLAAEQIDLVSFDALDFGAGIYHKYLFAAPRPFVPTGSMPPRDGYTVADYLKDLAVKNSQLWPRYAWWESTSATMGIYALLGIAIIGGIWPWVIRLIDGPAPGEPEYDLGRFGHEPTKQPQPATADYDRSHEMEDEMERSLQEAGSAQHPAATGPPPSIGKPSSDPLQPIAPTLGPAKGYAGEFYPVEKHAPHGFTLTELLIVIGIIAVLIAILMPALSAAREQAKRVQCMSNMRQLTMAWLMYTSDHKGHFCSPDVQNENSKNGGIWTWITDNGRQHDMTTGLLWPYVKALPVYFCPNDPHVPNTVYAINGYLAGAQTNPNVKIMGQVRYPNHTFVFIESAEDEDSDFGDGDDPDPDEMRIKFSFRSPIYNPASPQKRLYTIPGHYHGLGGSNGAMISFIDGHVQFWQYGYTKMATGFPVGSSAVGLQPDILQLESWSGGPLPPGGTP
jgi:prepilin-type N-terminal cleavage/methylation domain-containing protein/prepilin-type processing-associated H-X9-DG protein